MFLDYGYPVWSLKILKKNLCARALEGGGWGGMMPPYIFSAPHRSFELPFSPSFQKFITTVRLIALRRWLMASLVIRFFSSLVPVPSNRRTNFWNFVTKVNKIANTVEILDDFVYKALRAIFRHAERGAEGVFARGPGDTEGPWVQNCQDRMQNYGLRTPLV